MSISFYSRIGLLITLIYLAEKGQNVSNPKIKKGKN